MNTERARTFLLALPHVVETEQWGGLLFWVGDKTIGGKMFAMMNVDEAGMRITFPAGEEHFHELCEVDGLVPAPYLARAFWVSAERWDALRDREWEEEFRAGHARTFEKLPAKTRAVLAMPAAEAKKIVSARRKVMAAAEAAKKAAKKK